MLPSTFGRCATLRNIGTNADKLDASPFWGCISGKVRRLYIDSMQFFHKSHHIPDQTTEETMASRPVSNSKKQKVNILTFLGDVLFYLFLVVVVAIIAVWSGNGLPKMFFGYSAFTVLTSSMEDVIPKGSLVVVKQVPPEELKIGDDISYLAGETTVITHRIVGIEPDYLGEGKLGFQTKGTMNQEPDDLLVPQINIVGKVIFHSQCVGTVVNFIRAHWPLLIFIVFVILLSIKVLIVIYRS